MYTLLLATLLFHSFGTLAIVLGAAVNSLLPKRRAARTWELVAAGAASVPAAAPRPGLQLPQAA